MTIDVTCVIPTHHRPALLRRSLAAVLAQETPVAFEVVVVDDAGDAETAAVVAEAAAGSPRPVRLEHPADDAPPGASRSRNAGAAAARGSVVAFCDDDDVWAPDYLDATLSLLDAPGRPVDFVVAGIVLTDAEGGEMMRIRLPDSVDPAAVLGTNQGVNGSNIVVRAEALREVGGWDQSLPVGEDKDFLWRLVTSGKSYAVTPGFHCSYHWHEGPRLTDWSAAREHATTVYLQRHGAHMRRWDAWDLRRQVASIRFHRSTGAARWARAVPVLVLRVVLGLARRLGRG